MQVDLQKTRRRLRRQRGRYARVAELSGISRSWIAKYSRGVRGRRPSYDLIQRLIAALDTLEADGMKIERAPKLGKARRKASAVASGARKRG